MKGGKQEFLSPFRSFAFLLLFLFLTIFVSFVVRHSYSSFDSFATSWSYDTSLLLHSKFFFCTESCRFPRAPWPGGKRRSLPSWIKFCFCLVKVLVNLSKSKNKIPNELNSSFSLIWLSVVASVWLSSSPHFLLLDKTTNFFFVYFHASTPLTLGIFGDLFFNYPTIKDVVLLDFLAVGEIC